MMDRLSPLTSASDDAYSGYKAVRNVLHMRMGERTAGSMPVWESAATAQHKIEQDLSLAQAGENASLLNSKASLAYHPANGKARDDEFRFGDLIDMVNPLQHIPVVNHIYRKLTGDDIKPASKIVGGTVFGGAAGLAGGIVNLIVEKETGRDITGNTVAMLRGERPRFIDHAQPSNDLPGELLAFADLGYTPEITIERSDEKSESAKRPRAIWERD